MDTPSKAQEKQQELRELLLKSSAPTPNNIKINLLGSENTFTQFLQQDLDSQDGSRKNQGGLTLKMLSNVKKDPTSLQRKSMLLLNEGGDLSAKNKVNALKRFRKAALGIQFANAMIVQENLKLGNARNLDTIDIKNPQDCQIVINILQKPQRTKKEVALVQKAVQNLNFFETKRQELDVKLYEQLFYDLKHEFYKSEEAIYHYGESGKKCYIILKGSCSLLVPNTADEIDSNSQSKFSPKEFQRLKSLYEYRQNLNQTASPLKIPNQPVQISRVIKSIQEFQEGDFAASQNEKSSPEGLVNREKQRTLNMNINTRNQKQRFFFENSLGQNIGNQGDYKNGEQCSPNLTKSFNGNRLELSTIQQIDQHFMAFINFCLPDYSITCNYNQGNSFGDVALLTRSKQNGTVICREDTHIMSLSKESFDRILGEQQKQLIKKKISFLKQFSFFSLVPESGYLNLINCLQTVQFNKNDLVYQVGDSSDYLYFIISGEIEISQMIDVNDNSENGDQRQYQKQDSANINSHLPSLNFVQDEKMKQKNLKKAKIALLSANNCFGEKELIENQKRTQMARCISQQCEIYMIKRDMLQIFLRLYEGQRIFKEFSLKKEAERQKRIEQFIKVNHQIKEIQKREYQKLNFKAKSLKSHNPSLHDLLSPKESTNDLSQFENGLGTGHSLIINNLKSKVFMSPPPERIEETQEPKLEQTSPYFNFDASTFSHNHHHKSIINVSAVNLSAQNLDDNQSMSTLQSLSKQKLFQDLKNLSKQKKKIYRQLVNVHSTNSIDNAAQLEEQAKHHKAKKKEQKLEVIFDYFFEQTPLLNKIFAMKEPQKRKPLLSQSIENNNKMTNRIINTIVTQRDNKNQFMNKSTFENYMIPTFSDSGNSDQKGQGGGQEKDANLLTNTTSHQTKLYSFTTIQNNDNPNSTSRKEILPFINKENEEQLPQVSIQSDHSPKSQKNSKQLLQYHLSTHSQARSLSKEKNIHVKKLKEQSLRQSDNSRSLSNLIPKSELHTSTDIILQEKFYSPRTNSLYSGQKNQPSSLTSRHSIGREKKSLPSLYSNPIPLSKLKAPISEFSFPSNVQSPTSVPQGIGAFPSARGGFTSLNKLLKKQ